MISLQNQFILYLFMFHMYEYELIVYLTDYREPGFLSSRPN